MSKTFAHRLSEGWLPLQSITGPACRSPLGHGASQEFLPLQRMQMREPTHPGFASSRFRCGCRVSHPRAAFRLPNPPDLFRPVTLLGFSPSKLLPPAEPRRLSTPVALLPLPALGDVTEATCGRLANPASGPCSPPESVTIERGLVVRPLAAPLGFPRSRAFPACVAAGFPAAPLSGLRAPGSRQGRSASQGFDPLARCCAPRSEDRWEPQPFCDSRTSFPFRVLRAAASRARAERVPDIAARKVRSKGRPLSSPGGLAEGMSVPDAGRHPTLDVIIRDQVSGCQTIEGNRVTRTVDGRCNSLDRGALEATI